jgi:hypothetical protein
VPSNLLIATVIVLSVSNYSHCSHNRLATPPRHCLLRIPIKDGVAYKPSTMKSLNASWPQRPMRSLSHYEEYEGLSLLFRLTALPVDLKRHGIPNSSRYLAWRFWVRTQDSDYFFVLLVQKNKYTLTYQWNRLTSFEEYKVNILIRIPTEPIKFSSCILCWFDP